LEAASYATSSTEANPMTNDGNETEGIVQELSGEGKIGAPAGSFWVKLDSSASTYLANVSFVLQGLKVGNRVRLELDNGRLGQMVKSVTVLAEGGLEAVGEAERPETVASDNLLSTPSQPPTTPHRKAEGRLEFLDLKQLQESSWNPNEMNDETFASLIQDMREGGYFTINPIQVFPAETDQQGLVRYQIADGHHRFRAARKVPWEKIRAEVLDIEESEAKAVNYRKNHERGNLNPEKEAKLFFEEWEKGNGKLTQQQIADKYGISQNYVSDRLQSLPIYPSGIKPSHAEEIVHAVKNEDAQKAVARASVKQKLTPDETREVAERVANEVKVKPNAPKKFLRVKAERFAREVKKARMSPNAPVEIETVFCEDCDANFRIMHLGFNRHRVVKVADKEKELIE
jgi:ParB/RepB/Spo0J family partition protein